MTRKALLAVVALALVLPAAASAHATLRAEYPGFQQELGASPQRIWLHFDQAVQFPNVEVLDGRGRDFAGTAKADGLTIRAPLERLPRGDYTVRWHALSADGHVVSGVWTFGVRMKALPPTEAYGAGGPTGTEHVVRWLLFCSFAALVGALAFRLVCLRGLELPAAVEKRLTLTAIVAVTGAIELGILAFCLRAEDVLQLPFGAYLYGDLTPIADGTRFGRAFAVVTLGLALVAALVFLAWLVEWSALLVPALALSLALLSGFSLSGHDAVDPGSNLATEIADWVHLAAGSLWVGGLLALAVAVWPLAPAIRREAFLRFSRLATVLVGVGLVAGTYLAIVRLPHLSDLWTHGYGQVLLVKIALVSAAVAWGGFHHLVVRPRIRSATDGSLGRVGRSLLGESMIGVAVLLVAAVLVDSRPPLPQGSPPVTQAAQRR